MYEIMMKTWYQEFPNKTFYEAYNSLEWETIDEACEYLGKNYETILNYYPVEEIKIQPKYK